MNPGMRRLHLLLTIGGGFAGIIITLEAFFASKEANPLFYALLLAFVCLYGYGVFAGLRFAEAPEENKHLAVFYWLQVPWISSPIFAYRFASGFHVSGAIIGSQLSGFFRVGSDWQFSMLQSAPWGIGLNVFALVMAVVTMKKKKESIQAPETARG